MATMTVTRTWTLVEEVERPTNTRSGTSRTLVQQTPVQQRPVQQTPVQQTLVQQRPWTGVPESHASSSGNASPPNRTGGGQRVPPKKNGPFAGFTTEDVVLQSSMSIVLLWPWILFGVLWALNGVRMNNQLAEVVKNNPQATNFFVTVAGTALSMIVTSFFSLSIARFAEEWVANKRPVDVFHITVLSALRHQNWPWGTDIKTIRQLVDKKRLLPAISVLVCITTFAFVTASITSLLTPVPFSKTSLLTGTELDFASTAPDCLVWFTGNPIPSNCYWQEYKGLEYISCLGESQIADALESGRGNVLSLHSNDTQSIVLNQLGNNNGLHFSGSTRGVLPIGPNGVSAFDTLRSSPFSDPFLRDAMLSYNYTLNIQGFTSEVNCLYETDSPIIVEPSVANASSPTIQVTSACEGAVQVMTNVTFLPELLGNNTLTYWACQLLPFASGTSPEYFVYLRGLGFYEKSIGNISCDISIQPGIFPTTYQSVQDIFLLGNPNTSSTFDFTGLAEEAFALGLIGEALTGLGSMISQGQNWQGNEVAESVITLGVKSFGLGPYDKAPEYLRLYEAMIQGIIDYEATYARLIYSTVPDPPSSCIRTVTGSVTYEVIGWSVQLGHIGFMMPMTIINLASMVIFTCAVRMARKSGKKFDPTDPRSLMYAANVNHGSVPDEWKDTVSFSWKGAANETFQELLDQVLTQFDGAVKDAVKNAVQSAVMPT